MPRVPDLPCADCGGMMWRSTTSAPEGKARCRPCRRASGPPRKRRTSLTEYECVGCHAPVKRPPTKGQRPKWCLECRAKGFRELVCAGCLRDFAGIAGIRYCGDECRPRPQRKRGGEIVHLPNAPGFCWLPPQHPAMRKPTKRSDWWQFVIHGPCVWCGQAFTAVSATGSEKYCGKRCQSAAGRARHGRFVVSPLVRAAIYERDGWTCQLCLEVVDRDLMATDPYGDWAPSLDHIVPQSKGGAHEPENLRLAHRWCNAVRGDETYYTDADLRAA